MKLNGKGDILWSKIFGGAEDDLGYSLTEAKNGDLLVTGYTDSYGFGNNDCLLLRLDSEGNIKWAKVFGGVNRDESVSIIEATYNDGNINNDISGNNNINGNGSNINNNNANSNINNDDIIIAGYTTSYGMGNYDCLILRLNSEGNIKWAKTFGGIDNDRIYSIVEAKNGDIIAAGNTASFGAGGKDGIIMRLSKDGEIVSRNCMVDANIGQLDVKLSELDITSSILSSIVSLNIPAITGSVPPTDITNNLNAQNNDICQSRTETITPTANPSETATITPQNPEIKKKTFLEILNDLKYVIGLTFSFLGFIATIYNKRGLITNLYNRHNYLKEDEALIFEEPETYLHVPRDKNGVEIPIENIGDIRALMKVRDEVRMEKRMPRYMVEHLKRKPLPGGQLLPKYLQYNPTTNEISVKAEELDIGDIDRDPTIQIRKRNGEILEEFKIDIMPINQAEEKDIDQQERMIAQRENRERERNEGRVTNPEKEEEEMTTISSVKPLTEPLNETLTKSSNKLLAKPSKKSLEKPLAKQSSLIQSPSRHSPIDLQSPSRHSPIDLQSPSRQYVSEARHNIVGLHDHYDHHDHHGHHDPHDHHDHHNTIRIDYPSKTIFLNKDKEKERITNLTIEQEDIAREEETDKSIEEKNKSKGKDKFHDKSHHNKPYNDVQADNIKKYTLVVDTDEGLILEIKSPNDKIIGELKFSPKELIPEILSTSSSQEILEHNRSKEKKDKGREKEREREKEKDNKRQDDNSNINQEKAATSDNKENSTANEGTSNKFVNIGKERKRSMEDPIYNLQETGFSGLFFTGRISDRRITPIMDQTALEISEKKTAEITQIIATSSNSPMERQLQQQYPNTNPIIEKSNLEEKKEEQKKTTPSPRLIRSSPTATSSRGDLSNDLDNRVEHIQRKYQSLINR